METEREGGRQQSLVCWARGRVRMAQSDGVVGGGRTGDGPPHPTRPLLPDRICSSAGVPVQLR